MGGKIMRKNFKKVTALMMAVAMVGTLAAGCGKKEETKTETETGSKETEAEAADPENFVFDEEIEIQIPVYDRATEGAAPVDNNYWTQWIQSEFGDKHNVKVTYVSIPRSDDMNKFNMLLSTGDAPDVIFDYDYPDMVTYSDMGALQAVDMEMVKAWAPTFYGNMETNGILDYMAIDGEDTFIAATRPMAYNFMTLIRQDWLEACGLEMPSNLEEYEAALKAFKDKGLGGDSTIPMTLSLPVQGYVVNYPYRDFPLDEKELALYSDLSVASLSWEPTKNFLSTYNRFYNEGLVSKEFYLDADGSQRQADFISGKAGTYESYLSKNPDVVGSLIANDPNAKVAVLDPAALVPEGNKVAGRGYWPFGMIMGFNAESSEDEVKAVLMLLEWMSDSENLFTLQNGIEGVTYELDANGLPSLIACTTEQRLNYNSNKDMFCLVIEGKDYGSDEKNLAVQKTTFAPAGHEDLIQQSYDYMKKYEEFLYPDYLFDTNIKSVASNSATLLDKYKTAFAELVTCPQDEFESKYAELSKDYLNAGYQAILDEREAAFEASQK